MTNLAPDNQRVDPTSPYELLTDDYKLDYKTQLRIIFSDYAECKNQIASQPIQSNPEVTHASRTITNA